MGWDIDLNVNSINCAARFDEAYAFLDEGTGSPCDDGVSRVLREKGNAFRAFFESFGRHAFEAVGDDEVTESGEDGDEAGFAIGGDGDDAGDVAGRPSRRAVCLGQPHDLGVAVRLDVERVEHGAKRHERPRNAEVPDTLVGAHVGDGHFSGQNAVFEVNHEHIGSLRDEGHGALHADGGFELVRAITHGR